MCIPITGGSNYVDWTCVALGLDNGCVYFYSDNGNLVYEKHFHTESVLNIRMIGDDFTIYYPTCVAILQTNHLTQILKSFKEMYSRAKTTKIDLMDKDFILLYRKWEYKTDIVISDAVMIHQQKICLFDHLVSESIEMGFNKKYRLAPSTALTLIATGSNPYLSFYLARDGFKQNFYTDVAKAVVNKFTSKLPSWLTGSQPQSSDKSDAQESQSETLYHHHDLCDYQRTGCAIFLAPGNHYLAAIADSLGRVILVDLKNGTILRIWKGYREAQCAFFEVSETRNRKEQPSVENMKRRTGLFMIIYAPKKAMIEIWCMQYGPKVATFNASRHGFLLYNSHDISLHKSKSKPFCLFFDADENSLKSFSIPFHCILSGSNSKSAEDFHHFKRLKMLMKNVNLKYEKEQSNILEVIEKFHTAELKLKCLDLIVNNRKAQPNLVRQIIDIFLKGMEGRTDEEPEDGEIPQDFILRNQLTVTCLNYRSLVNCFTLANEKSEVESTLNVSLEMCDAEYLTVSRIVELTNLTKSGQTNKRKNVKFQDTEESLSAFLTSFVVNIGENILVCAENCQTSFDQIGHALFKLSWNDEMSMSKLQDIFAISRISSRDIMKSFLNFWLSRDIDFTDEDQVMRDMTKFKNILDQACVYAGDKVNYAYNCICLYWQDVREILLESSNPVNALLAALICRAYALKKQDGSPDFAGFEQVTQEECQWTLLAEKLNDVAVLSIFVSQFGNGHDKEKYEIPDISLKKILNDGKGVISELVASWLIAVNLPLDIISKSSKDEKLQPQEKNVIKKLEILREHFPYSLNAPVILCYVIWDLLSKKWSKNLAELHYLEQGIEYLRLFDEKDFHLKHGLCELIWNANFKIPLKATQKLINKVGKLPKEKICVQTTMIPDFLMARFLDQTTIFLEHFRSSLEFNNLEFKCEEILTQDATSSSSLSLYELILNQQRANLILINLHYEMIKVLELIAFLNIKYTKPMQSLFDDISNDAFFMEINKQIPYAVQKADEIRKNTRIFFLKKAVTSTIDLVVDCQTTTYFDDHIKWIEKTKILSKIWDLDVALLERHQVG